MNDKSSTGNWRGWQLGLLLILAIWGACNIAGAISPHNGWLMTIAGLVPVVAFVSFIQSGG